MKKKLGFTIIEVIIVISIVSIFIVIGTRGFSTSVADRQLKADADLILDNIQITRDMVLSRKIDGNICGTFIGHNLVFYKNNFRKRIVCNNNATNTLYEITGSQIYFDNTQIIKFNNTDFTLFSFNYLSPDARLDRDLSFKVKHKIANRCVDITLNQGYAPPTVSEPRPC